MDHSVGMKIVIEAEKGSGSGRPNGSSLNFAQTIPGSNNGLIAASIKHDFRTTNQNSFNRLHEMRAPDSPAPPLRNKNNGFLTGDSIFGVTATNNQLGA